MVPGKRRDEDVCGLGRGECHRMIQMSLPIGLYRARKLLKTPRMGRVWKVQRRLEGSTQFYTMMEGMRGV